MSLVGIYIRVLQLLGKEARLGWILAAANLVLAATQFAEPVLFGRIVDVLSGKMGPATSAWPLLGAWAAFGRSRSPRVPRSHCTRTGWRTASARRS